MTEEIQEWYILVDTGHGKFEEKVVQVTLDEGSYISIYCRLVNDVLHGDTSLLKAFEHTIIHDIHGNAYKLVTDVDTLHLWKRSQLSEEKRDYRRWEDWHD